MKNSCAVVVVRMNGIEAHREQELSSAASEALELGRSRNGNGRMTVRRLVTNRM
ncbi:hypothetical protein [Pantoea stewartii]|uniref:hypothetical protein n=1 Tax=Pantoea stewartii TaxID=66269 RepID=UPI0025A096E5|nr:hypothetical protein [Pantoea stewartii]